MSLLKRPPTIESILPCWFEQRSLSEWPEWVEWVEWPERSADDEFRLEESRDGDHLVIRAELLGIDPEKDVEVTVSDGTLRIRAERHRSETVGSGDGHRSEFRYGSFARSIRLPLGASEDDVTAGYVDGILEVRLPLAKEAGNARKIPIARS